MKFKAEADASFFEQYSYVISKRLYGNVQENLFDYM